MCYPQTADDGGSARSDEPILGVMATSEPGEPQPPVDIAQPDASDGSAPLEAPDIRVGPDTIPGLVRQVRRLAGLNQRELAEAARLSQATVARVEAGRLAPSLATLLRVLAAGQFILVVTDVKGSVVQPLAVWDDTRDGARRTYPAHLDLIIEPRSGEWWADGYGLARPPETFHRDPLRRERRRRRSQWEVRVKQFRHVPPPPRG